MNLNTDLNKERGGNNGRNGVVADFPLLDKVEEGAEHDVLCYGLEHPAGPDHVAEGGGPGGEDHADQHEPFPKGKLHHVHAVLGTSRQIGLRTDEKQQN